MVGSCRMPFGENKSQQMTKFHSDVYREVCSQYRLIELSGRFPLLPHAFLRLLAPNIRTLQTNLMIASRDVRYWDSFMSLICPNKLYLALAWLLLDLLGHCLNSLAEFCRRGGRTEVLEALGMSGLTCLGKLGHQNEENSRVLTYLISGSNG